ncbi:MAG: polysaccharide pyruvyl transferase family protein [Armatimonadetes bacterium]|nr:polysaccharide pyruvyl transferase family protein [Armatimonadota bacterium]
MSERQRSVALCGFYGKHNYGDDLMADCLTARLTSLGSTVNVFSDTTQPGVHNGLKDPVYLTSDTIVIGGGNIIGPGFWAFKDGRLEELTKAKQIVFLNVGVTADYFADKEFVSQLRDLRANWWVRDLESVKLLADEGMAAEFLPDISLTLDNSCGTRNEKTLAVLLNAYPMNDIFKANDIYRSTQVMQTARLIAHHLDWMVSFGWKVCFLPCHVSATVDDRLAAGIVYGLMERKLGAEWVVDKLSWTDLMARVASCNLVMSMRYHASTTALVTGTPFVDLVHHAKNKQFVRSVGAEHCAVDVWHASHEDLIQATQAAENFDTSQWSDITTKAQEQWRLFDKEWLRITSVQ